MALLETIFRLSQTTDEPGDEFHQPRCLAAVKTENTWVYAQLHGESFPTTVRDGWEPVSPGMRV